MGQIAGRHGPAPAHCAAQTIKAHPHLVNARFVCDSVLQSCFRWAARAVEISHPPCLWALLTEHESWMADRKRLRDVCQPAGGVAAGARRFCSSFVRSLPTECTWPSLASAALSDRSSNMRPSAVTLSNFLSEPACALCSTQGSGRHRYQCPCPPSGRLRKARDIEDTFAVTTPTRSTAACGRGRRGSRVGLHLHRPGDVGLGDGHVRAVQQVWRPVLYPRGFRGHQGAVDSS